MTTRKTKKFAKGVLPAKAPRTNKRQLTFTLSDGEANILEMLRRREMARSWGEVVRLLIVRAIRAGETEAVK